MNSAIKSNKTSIKHHSFESEENMQEEKNKLSTIFAVIRCFNVAAICALAIWNSYAFYLNQAVQRAPSLQQVEMQLVPVSTADRTAKNRS